MNKGKGCGCQTGLLRFLPVPYAKFFYIACAMHDDDYDRGGTPEDRLQADRWLYRRMLKTIRKTKESPLRSWWLGTVALGYYYAVRIMGRFYFNSM